MLKINKSEEPEFFIKFNEKKQLKNWSDFDFEIKNDLKEYMLENEQKIDNTYFCPYCEREIKIEKSQIEHIKPKDKFPKLFNNYNNFLVGCLENHTCGSKKGNKWNENFINPVEENPESYFTYNIRTGEIVPKFEKETFEFEKAIKTIEILNLNEKKLCEIRKIFILSYFKNPENLKYVSKFPTLKKFILEKKK